jgi:hypothetical protein
VGTYDHIANTQKLYVDGTLDNSRVTSGDLVGTNNALLTLNSFAGAYGQSTWRELRVSDIIRSDIWISVTNYTCTDNLVMYNNVEIYTEPAIPPVPAYYFHGYIKEKSVPVARRIFLYDRVTGVLIDSAMSDSSSGYYLLETFDNAEHFIVVMDDTEGDVYNPIIRDKLPPNGK